MIHDIESIRKKYHKLKTCYRWEYNKLLALNLTSLVASSAMIIAGGTLCVFFPGAVAILGGGVAIMLSTKKLEIETRMNVYWFASWECGNMVRIIDEGELTDEQLTLEMLIVDSSTQRLCPPITAKMEAKYEKRYSAMGTHDGDRILPCQPSQCFPFPQPTSSKKGRSLTSPNQVSCTRHQTECRQPYS